MNSKSDVVIIGAGPSGLSSGIQLAEFGLKVVALEAAKEPGGALRRIERIDYYPGFPHGTRSAKFVEGLVSHAEKRGLIICTNEEVTSLSLKEKNKLVKTTKSKHSAKAIIIASGSPDAQEKGWFGNGIFYCVECCKDFLCRRDLVLIGYTSESIDESINLADFSSQVTLVNQANSILLDPKDRERLNRKAVNLIEDHVAVRIEGKPLEKLVTLRRVSGHEESTLTTNGVVVISRLNPIVEILRKEGVKTHRQGCIIVNEHGNTNIDGVFAVGSCTSVCKVGAPLCVGEGSIVAAAVRFYLLE